MNRQLFLSGLYRHCHYHFWREICRFYFPGCVSNQRRALTNVPKWLSMLCVSTVPSSRSHFSSRPILFWRRKIGQQQKNIPFSTLWVHTSIWILNVSIDGKMSDGGCKSWAESKFSERANHLSACSQLHFCEGKGRSPTLETRRDNHNDNATETKFPSEQKKKRTGHPSPDTPLTWEVPPQRKLSRP